MDYSGQMPWNIENPVPRPSGIRKIGASRVAIWVPTSLLKSLETYCWRFSSFWPTVRLCMLLRRMRRRKKCQRKPLKGYKMMFIQILMVSYCLTICVKSHTPQPWECHKAFPLSNITPHSMILDRSRSIRIQLQVGKGDNRRVGARMMPWRRSAISQQMIASGHCLLRQTQKQLSEWMVPLVQSKYCNISL